MLSGLARRLGEAHRLSFCIWKHTPRHCQCVRSQLSQPFQLNSYSCATSQSGITPGGTGAEARLSSTAVLEQHIGPLSVTPTVPESEPLLVVVSGPSGAGKDAVIGALRQARPDLKFLITATSRARRLGEEDGKDYFFVSKAEFEAWIGQGDMLEYATVYGEYKGIQRSQLDAAIASGADVIMRIDVQGAQTIRKLIPDAVSIFLVAESETKLVERLLSRKSEPMESMLMRAKTARSELTHISKFDYVVVNKEDKLAEAASSIAAIIDAEKLRVTRLNRP